MRHSLEIGQSLTGLKLCLENIASLPADRIQADLSEVQRLVRGLSDRVRNMSLDLRPSMLDDLGLLAALLWHFDRYTFQTNVKVNFKHNGLNRRFSSEVETTVYRLVQEALTNVARYAYVNDVDVLIIANQDKIYLKIEDKGIGFDPETALTNKNSSGLAGMYERVSLQSGQLIIDSAPEKGTRLTAKFSLRG